MGVHITPQGVHITPQAKLMRFIYLFNARIYAKVKVKVNQYLRNAHCCLEPMSTNNPSQRSVVLESSAKPKH